MHNSDVSGCCQPLRQRGWLSTQSPELADALISRGRLRHFRRGDVLHRESGPPGGMYGIVSGGIGISTLRRDGEAVLGNILRPGDWSGEGPLMLGGNRTLTYRAMEDSDVLCVPLVALQAIGQAYPDATRAFGNLSERGVAISVTVIGDLLIPDAQRRIAATLLRVTGVLDGITASAGGFQMTQSELGEMANSSRNHVNRTLQGLAASGLITVRYNRIIINDVAGLRAYVESPPGE